MLQTIKDICGVICERPPKDYPRQILPKENGVGDTIHNWLERLGIGAKVKSYFAKQKRSCGCEQRRQWLNQKFPYKPKRGEVFLTIGMAHFQDWEGAWATIQSIWSEAVAAGVADLIEILVVDQSSDSPHGEKLRGYLQGWGIRSKYISQPNIGTAMGKHAVFANATGEWVLLLDCHADLVPGSLGQIVNWMIANRFDKNLYGGVMEFGGGYQWYRERIAKAAAATKRQRTKKNLLAMLAPQTVSAIEACDNKQTAAERIDCVCGTDRGYHSHVDRVWRGDSLGRWATDPRAADPQAKPFKVDNLAGWFLFCRREMWLRLHPYHPLMKGFGGEEGVMTLAWEKAGLASYIHPAARGTHRFGRAEPPKFALNLHDRIKNYALAFTQWDRADELERMRTYFLTERESGPMDETEFDSLIATAVAEHHAYTEEAKAKRKPSLSLDERYRLAAETPSDCNEHVPILRDLASQVEHVTELGSRFEVTTVALLAAQPKTLRAVIPGCSSCQREALAPIAGQTDLKLIADDWLTAAVEPTELLFIDTRGTAEQLRQELNRWAASVSRWIVRHDSIVYGDRGEDGGPGLRVAINEFLTANPEWTVTRDLPNNHGLIILEKHTSPPPTTTQTNSDWLPSDHESPVIETAEHVADFT